MSLNIEGASCARCKAFLFPEDDIVYCPVCGAPHHRECYDALGHCAFEDLHGTDRQYSRESVIEAQQKAEEAKLKLQSEKQETEQTVKCKMCGESYPYRNKSCPKCGAPNFIQINGVNGFDFLGGVPAETEIADGVKASEAQKFVISNTFRYIPKFAKFKENRKASWNWLAFFFPNCWLLSRKMYKRGIITTLLLLIAILLVYPITRVFINTDISQLFTSEMLLKPVSELPANSGLIFAAAAIGSVIEMIIKIITAVFGDYWYYKHTVASVKAIREESSDNTEDAYRKKGGVNVFMFLAGYLALQYLPVILLMFL